MITEVKERIFEEFEVRKSKKQKTAFIDYITGLCEENGISVNVEKKEGSRNIVMGASPEESEMVLGAHYDTCAVMFFPNFITPKNMLIYIIYQILLCFVIFLPGVLVSILLSWLGLHEFAPMAFGLGGLLMLFLLMFGPANRHTANDNTSGVITVLNIMLSMTPEQREKVCFVLFDNEEVGLLGSAAFASMHKKTMKDKLLINYDCVSDGDNLFVKLSKKDKKGEIADELKSSFTLAAEDSGMSSEVGTSGFYPSDQANFKRGIAVACFRKSKLCGLYLGRIHTPKDTVFIDRNIECITAATLDFAQDILADKSV